jgi:membrane fusion protein, multidrug efflux system
MTIHANPHELAQSVADKTAAPHAPAELRDVANAPASTTAAPAGTIHRVRNLLMAAAAAAAVAAAIIFGWNYWTVGRFEVSTDDAYVQADNTTVAPKISGYIAEVAVADNEAVKSGHVLARIDDRDYKVALDQAKANVEQARSTIASKQAALEIQDSAIDAARAALKVDQASLTFAEQDNKRYSDLAASGSGSLQNAQLSASRYAVATASVQRDAAAVVSAVKQIDALKADLAQAQANLAGSLAAVRQAELNLGYTTVSAPVDGVIGNRTLRVGQYVQAGTQLMAVVPTARAYIVANFKETQLTHVQPGQPVDVEVDTFPGVVAHGVVDSIAPASGQQFALLPPDNATGNFTKIVQRIPVKIVLDGNGPLSGKLRPGMSVTPTIDTKQAATHVAAGASK